VTAVIVLSAVVAVIFLFAVLLGLRAVTVVLTVVFLCKEVRYAVVVGEVVDVVFLLAV